MRSALLKGQLPENGCRMQRKACSVNISGCASLKVRETLYSCEYLSVTRMINSFFLLSEVSCTVEKLAEVIDSCEDQIHSYVIPYSKNRTDKRAMKFACQ